jgi:hypothetical protein
MALGVVTLCIHSHILFFPANSIMALNAFRHKVSSINAATRVDYWSFVTGNVTWALLWRKKISGGSVLFLQNHPLLHYNPPFFSAQQDSQPDAPTLLRQPSATSIIISFNHQNKQTITTTILLYYIMLYYNNNNYYNYEQYFWSPSFSLNRQCCLLENIKICPISSISWKFWSVAEEVNFLNQTINKQTNKQNNGDVEY